MAAKSRRRSLQPQLALLSCARPDVVPGSLLASMLTGGAIVVGMATLGTLSSEIDGDVIVGLLATGAWLTLPYAVFHSANRVEKGAKILFEGGEPVLLALGFHDRRLAIGLAGGVVLSAVATMIGALPPAVLVGVMSLQPPVRFVTLFGTLTLLAAAFALAFATIRLTSGQRTKSIWKTVVPWVLSLVTVVFLVETAWTGPGLSLDVTLASNLGSALWQVGIGMLGLSITYEVAGGFPIEWTSVFYPVVAALIAGGVSVQQLATIPEGDAERPQPGDGAAPHDQTKTNADDNADDNADANADANAAERADEPADGGRLVTIESTESLDAPDEVDASDAPAVVAPPRDDYVAEIEWDDEDDLFDDNPLAAIDEATAANRSLAVAANTVRPGRQRARTVARAPVVSRYRDPAQEGKLWRTSKPWPETNVFGEWDRRIMPTLRWGVWITVVTCVLTLCVSFVLLELLGPRKYQGVGTMLYVVVGPLMAIVGLANTFTIPRRLLREQLSGGTEALMMADISPLRLSKRAVLMGTALGVSVVVAVTLPLLVLAFGSSGGTAREIFLATLGVLQHGVCLAVALAAISAVTAIRGSGELTVAVFVIFAIFVPQVAAVVFSLLWISGATQMTISQRPPGET